MIKSDQKDNKPKIYERNPDTGVIRWRYIGESPDVYGWPDYGNILDTKENVQLYKKARRKD
tara:strand:- start:98 stop:280 length:183 start_codon:yes stop_codon:yes gene_type:complete